jgi:crotonobetainyl-CoA:carnitine CoA-transferase CaiB-like acyl-CoA transferase
MLSPYRVIDLTNEMGILCGQMLADLGADVIQVEPPGGSTARQTGPWLDEVPGPERSLFWWAYTRNKRGMVIDFENPADIEVLRELAATADFWIESEPPGRMEALGLGYEDLAAINPGIVYISISPFGQMGPKAHWQATDLTQIAASGAGHLNGEGESPPVRVSAPQAHCHAGADAAVGALIAHFEKKRSGKGQHVDISHQQSLTLATMFRSLDIPLDEAKARRIAGGTYITGVFLPNRFELADGWVTLGPSMLPSTGHFMKRLMKWIAEEGFCGPDLVEENWGGIAFDMVAGKHRGERYLEAAERMTAFFATRTKAVVIEEAVKRRLLIAPILELGDMIESEQLASRNFLIALEKPEGEGTLRFPGPFARFGEAPIQYRYPPPQINEHGAAIRKEAALRTTPVSFPSKNPGQRPLEGVKILDLFWVLAGPGSTRMLADYGATVIRVESTQHLDTLRIIPPYQFGQPHPEGSGAFQSANANKLGITLDLANEEGRKIALELAKWADVVTESFAPGVIEQYGLGWETLRRENPDLIMISSCLMGQTGPWRNFTGFGNLAANVTGFQPLASWPDRPPAGPYGAYTDFIGVRYNATAILAALEYRDRTGKGQYIDQSQAEAALHFLAPSFLAHTANANVPTHQGNTDTVFYPHDFYPCQGKDRWVAIAVRNDEEWHAVCALLNRPELRERRGDSKTVDQAIAQWTAEQDAQAVATQLQACGVPAHPVLDTQDLYECPQLQGRDHFLEVEHDIYPTTTVEGSRLKYSRSQTKRPNRALNFGRDNREVLESILGYSPEEIAGLAERKVLR